MNTVSRYNPGIMTTLCEEVVSMRNSSNVIDFDKIFNSNVI